MKVGLIGKKIGMTQVFKDGKRIPVTVVKVEPNYVLQIKNERNDGYNALQMGALKNKWYRGTKPILVHVMTALGMSKEEIEKEIKKRKSDKLFTLQVLKEFKIEDTKNYKVGDIIDISKMAVDDKVTIIGNTKGRGFQGVVKRYNFHLGPKSHGSHSYREPGSVGMCADPGRVLKGKKMPGHMGTNQITIKGVIIVDIIPEKGVLMVKGSLPGATNSVVYIQK
jgi:large subunit ribosomal protein L3